MKKVQYLKMNIIFIFFCVFSLLIFPTLVQASTNQELPVIEIEDISETFTPQTYGNWDYYTIEPGTDYPYIEYLGLSGEAYYTDARTYDFRQYSTDLIKNEDIGSILRSDDSRSISNPFFDPESYPRAVRTESKNEAIFQLKQKTPFNVHLDYSFTFLAEADIPYIGQINHSDPFFLDIEIRNEDASGWVYLTQAWPSIYNLKYHSMTYPVFPQNESITQSFEITLDGTSLVTITPHRMDLPSSFITLEANTSYSGEISQGGILEIDEDTNFISYGKNEIFSICIFSLQMEEGKSYKLYLNTINHLPTGFPSDLLIYFIDDFVQIHSGTLDYEDELMISASESGDASLVIQAIGMMDLEYTLYFKEMAEEDKITYEIKFNEDLSLEEDQFYYFTLLVPSVLAINWTEFYSLSFYIQDPISEDLRYLTNHNFFDPEYGWLYGDSVGDLGTNWRYIPVGNYKIYVNDKDSSQALIRFNVIPINDLSNSETNVINKDSIVAFEPQMIKNQYNMINLSTSDRIHQSVLYEYSIIEKFGEGIYSTSSGTRLGYYESGGSLYPWDFDGVNIYSDLPTLKSEVPIIIIRPYQAFDSANNITTNYAATLKVTCSVATDYYPSISKDFIGYGYFISKTGISGTSSVTLDDFVPSGYQILGIPLMLEPYNLYNISVHLTGDVSFRDHIYVHGGNLKSLLVFNEYDRKYSENETIDTFTILTVSSISYLYINIDKSSDIARLDISFETISSSELYFESLEMLKFLWTTERNKGEVANKELAATQIIPSEMKPATPAFEFLIVVVAIITCISIFRKRQKMY